MKRRASRALLGDRLNEFQRRNPLLATLLFVAVLLTALVNVGSAIRDASSWARRTFAWRHMEYERLSVLGAGIDVGLFERTLGDPLLRRRAHDGDLVELTFRGRDYWVQAVADRDGTVVLYSVTSCDDDFRPRFALQGAPSESGEPVFITLQSTRFADATAEPRDVRFFMGATANFQYRESVGGGNPSNYQRFYVGLNDLCPPLRESEDQVPLPPIDARDFSPDYAGSLAGMPSLAVLREGAVINTYGETFSLWYLSEYDRESVQDAVRELESKEIPVQLGVNRLDVRHLMDEEYPASSDAIGRGGLAGPFL